MNAKVLQHTDIYNYCFNLTNFDLNSNKLKLVVFHFSSGETNLRWTSRLRYLKKTNAKMRMLENSIAYILNQVMINKILKAIENNIESIVINGYRYFNGEWVDYVETINVTELTMMEW